MELKKIKGKNSYTWSGITLGKLIAIRNELNTRKSEGRISPVAYDVYVFLRHQNLDNQKEFS